MTTEPDTDRHTPGQDTSSGDGAATGVTGADNATSVAGDGEADNGAADNGAADNGAGDNGAADNGAGDNGAAGAGAAGSPASGQSRKQSGARSRQSGGKPSRPPRTQSASRAEVAGIIGCYQTVAGQEQDTLEAAAALAGCSPEPAAVAETVWLHPEHGKTVDTVSRLQSGDEADALVAAVDMDTTQVTAAAAAAATVSGQDRPARQRGGSATRHTLTLVRLLRSLSGQQQARLEAAADLFRGGGRG